MLLSLLNVDPGPNNTNEVAATGAVRVWIGGAVVSGVVASYTYRPATHDVLINTMTLGTQTGALQFGALWRTKKSRFQPSVEMGRKNVDKNIDKHKKQ